MANYTLKQSWDDGDIIVILIAAISIIITEFASCLTSELKKFYPNTYKARYAIGAYNQHRYWEHEDPTVITIHETTLNYGGPEEGGWWYQAGYPVLSHCIFSKKQAIQAFIQYFEEYEIEGQPSLGDTTTYSNYELMFSNRYASVYPKTKPYYC